MEKDMLNIIYKISHAKRRYSEIMKRELILHKAPSEKCHRVRLPKATYFLSGSYRDFYLLMLSG